MQMRLKYRFKVPPFNCLTHFVAIIEHLVVLRVLIFHFYIVHIECNVLICQFSSTVSMIYSKAAF